MRKNIFLSLTASAVLATFSYAGGDLIPNYEPVVSPVEPTATQQVMPVYVGAGLIRGKYENGCLKECKYEDVTYGAMLRAGYEINEYVGIEARYLATFWDADELGGQELQHVGLYVKPMLPINEQFNVYALLGYGMTTTTTGGNKKLEEVDDNGIAAGIGFEYDISTDDDRDENTLYNREFDGHAGQEKGWGLFVDYQRLLIKSDTPDMDVFSAGITYDF